MKRKAITITHQQSGRSSCYTAIFYSFLYMRRRQKIFTRKTKPTEGTLENVPIGVPAGLISFGNNSSPSGQVTDNLSGSLL